MNGCPDCLRQLDENGACECGYRLPEDRDANLKALRRVKAQLAEKLAKETT